MINRLLGHPDRLQSQRCLLLHDLLTRWPQKQSFKHTTCFAGFPSILLLSCTWIFTVMTLDAGYSTVTKTICALYIWWWPYRAQIIPGSTCGLYYFSVVCAFHVFTFKLEWLEQITVMTWCCINSGWNIPLGRTHCMVFYLWEYWSFGFILDAAGGLFFFK